MASIQYRRDRLQPNRARYWGPAGRLHSRSFARKDGLGWHITRVAGLPRLDAPEHITCMALACWQLGGWANLAQLGLHHWAHMLGFGGHFATKSRECSSTVTALRWVRAEYAIRRCWGEAEPLGAWGRPVSSGASVPGGWWQFTGVGHRTRGEAWSTASAGAEARKRRRTACEEAASSDAT